MHPTLEELDHRHLWHPYTDAATYMRQPHCSIERAEGVYLYDSEGNALLDGIASWWCVSLGHSQPRIVEAIQRQAATLQHCILGGMTNTPAVHLAERIARMTPGDLNRVYFAADGSSATEAALKMAVQHWRYRDEPQRTRFVALENGYHGDTLGAVAAGFTSWFQEPFGALVKPALLAPSPHAPTSDPEESERHAEEALDQMRRIVEENATHIAAVILEPLCQGAAGIWIYPESYLRGVRALCDEYELLLIADEIAVGFGRTGAMFACQRAEIVPDILCIGKALTGGYLPMSAAVATEHVYDAFLSRHGEKRVFWDGHTYCGNPITAAAGLAALDLFDELDLPAACAALEAQLAHGFLEIARHPGVRYHKSLGMIGMCAFEDTAEGAARAYAASLEARKRGLFVRPLGPTLYLWPPLTTTPDELDKMLAALDAAIDCTARG
jgi:adenosylmethionine-8-amino-7-oxononanoate aminotransferase